MTQTLLTNLLNLKNWIFISLLFHIYSNAYGSQLKFYTQEFSPFSYTENGEVKGPAAKIIRQVCAMLKMDCMIKSMSWSRAQKAVKKGKANAMFVIGWNKPRSKWLYFTHPLMQTGYGFFVKKDSAFEYTNPEDLNGMTVGVYGPSNTSRSLFNLQEQLKNSGKGSFKIDMRPNDEPGFQKVSKGRIDAVYSNKDVGLSIIKKLLLKNVKFSCYHRKLEYFIGFSMEHNDKKVFDKFNEGLKNFNKSGELQKILDHWSMKAAVIKE